ncbi:hypothetical protein BC830DRAFT_1117748 [Chytriomyces sp. MP71]|nr:hypothetical protein BC830DRAFT_1117748 [Chytriomyces sp. MP71]
MEPAVGAALVIWLERPGLTKTQFMWLGNEPRSLGVSICFTGKVLAESQEIRPVDRSQSKLLALGIEVPNLDGLIRRWEWERPNEVLWFVLSCYLPQPDLLYTGNLVELAFPVHSPSLLFSSPSHPQPGVGQYAHFKDPNNDLQIEIFAAKTLEHTDAPKDAKAAALAADTAVATTPLAAGTSHASLSHATPSRSRRASQALLEAIQARRGVPRGDIVEECGDTLHIDLMHLGGLRRTLSVAAIGRVKESRHASFAPKPRRGVEADEGKLELLDHATSERIHQMEERVESDEDERMSIVISKRIKQTKSKSAHF